MRVVLVALSCVALAGCAAPVGGGPDVAATFYPLAFAAERLAPSNLTVGTVVPAGIEPHDWEPTTTDVSRLATARLVLAQGGGFEPWLDGLIVNLGAAAPRVVVTTSAIQLTERSHEEPEADGAHAQEGGAPDPHTWIAPRLFARQAQVIASALGATWPEHASAIDARSETLQAELQALHEEYAQGLADCEVRLIVANHDAYGYLAREYGFEVVALGGLSPEAEPDPETLAAAVDIAREHDLAIIFFEELVSPRVAEVVAQEVGAQTRVLSPIESRPDDGDYVTLMRENLVNLREAMRCT